MYLFHQHIVPTNRENVVALRTDNAALHSLASYI